MDTSATWGTTYRRHAHVPTTLGDLFLVVPDIRAGSSSAVAAERVFYGRLF